MNLEQAKNIIKSWSQRLACTAPELYEWKVGMIAEELMSMASPSVSETSGADAAAVGVGPTRKGFPDEGGSVYRHAPARGPEEAGSFGKMVAKVEATGPLPTVLAQAVPPTSEAPTGTKVHWETLDDYGRGSTIVTACGHDRTPRTTDVSKVTCKTCLKSAQRTNDASSDVDENPAYLFAPSATYDGATVIGRLQKWTADRSERRTNNARRANSDLRLVVERAIDDLTEVWNGLDLTDEWAAETRTALLAARDREPSADNGLNKESK